MTTTVLAADTILPVRRSRVASSLSLLCFSLFSAAAMHTLLAPLQEVVKADLHLSDLQISLIQGVAVSIPVALLSLPIGWLTDVSSRARMMKIMMVLSVIGAVITVFAQDFTLLFVSRMLTGMGAVCILPVALSMASDLSSPQTRGRATLIVALGQKIGIAVAFILGGVLYGKLATSTTLPFLGEISSWREISLFFAIAGGISGFVLLWLIEPARHEQEITKPLALWPAIVDLWQHRYVMTPLFIGQMTVVMADAAAAIWAAPVLIRDYHQQPAQFGPWMGMVILFGGILGAIAGGVLADVGQKSKMRGGLLLSAVIAAVIAVPASLFPILPGVTDFAWAMAILIFCGSLTGLVTAVAIGVYLPNELRGLCLGLFVVLGAVVGLAGAPVIVSLISTALGGESHVAMALAITGTVTSFIAVIGFVVAILRVRKTRG